MKLPSLLVLTVAFASTAILCDPVITPGFRPPSVPLIVTDPYTSYWSPSNNLYDAPPQHWSGSEMGMVGMIRIDSNVYRYMGGAGVGVAVDVMDQVNVTVYPTQTVYVFSKNGIRLTVTFSTPAVMEEGTDFVGLPVTFISYHVESLDGAHHSVQLYYDNTAEGTVSDVSYNVTWLRPPLLPGEVGMGFGSASQKFADSGSDRINWGYWYVSTILGSSVDAGIGYADTMRSAFMNGDHFPAGDIDKVLPCKQGDKMPVLAVSWNIASVERDVTASRFLRVFYDQVYGMSYYGTVMEPLWRHKYGNLTGAIRALDLETNIDACNAMDDKVLSSLYQAGRSNYAALGALAWRQAIGGLTAVWNNVTNTSWIFLKEISSDGDVSTVDVLYPASPMYLWASPQATKEMLLPLLAYANNDTAKYGMYVPYNLAWAPHHLGHWPVCDLKPDQQEQMPVEESGNMLAMLATVVQRQNNDVTFLARYWDLLKIWADFIVASLPDPGNQLCTDDFEGSSPHNTNLAAKGIVGLSAYVTLLQARGRSEDEIAKNQKLITGFLSYWTSKALSKDHYARQFDLLNSWSLKYNFLFQTILKTSDFDESVFELELNYYKTKKLKYGIPLDDRHPYTKTDWLMWVAAFASDDLFLEIVDSVYDFANTTPDRVPFTDWYNVETGRMQGFKARPVIGGIYARLLTTGT